MAGKPNKTIQGNPLISGLKRSGGRITTQRISICNWLIEHEAEHPTVHDIYQALSKVHPTMSLATVYNTVTALTDLDLLHEVGYASDGSTRYDVNLEPHINLVCLRCGKIVDYPHIDMAAFQEAAQSASFEMHNLNLAIHGICQECQLDQQKETK